MQFETTRSPLGELVYQLKYRNGPLNDIVETAVAFVSEWWNGPRHRHPLALVERRHFGDFSRGIAVQEIDLDLDISPPPEGQRGV